MVAPLALGFANHQRGCRPSPHNVVVELEAAILGSEIIAHLLQPVAAGHSDVVVDLLCNYNQGRGGERPTKGALKEADGLRKAYEKWCAALDAGKNPPGNSVLRATFEVYDAARAVELTGDPDKDWRGVRAVLEDGGANVSKMSAPRLVTFAYWNAARSSDKTSYRIGVTTVHMPTRC